MSKNTYPLKLPTSVKKAAAELASQGRAQVSAPRTEGGTER